MRATVLLRAVGFGLALLVAGAAYAHHGRQTHGIDPAAPEGSVELADVRATAAFSPRGGGQALIVSAIGAAHQSIRVQAYGFSNHAILAALADAKRRGVDVRVILDKSDVRGRERGAAYVAAAGIPVWIDYRPAIAHNKVIIIDGEDLITGSFNFTEAAQEKNAENVLYLQGVPALAKLYVEDWDWRQGVSRAYADAVPAA
jgi:phosphatidylserine/phosphatidylglycerophosphate/cardiolipin synthase-like enzyme